jgi:adenylate cyclase
MTQSKPKQNASGPPKETRGSGWSGLARVFLVSLLIAVLVAALEQCKLLTKPDMQSYDFLVKCLKPEPPSENILFVDFDEATVTAYNAFPLPRTLVAEAIEKVSRGTPKVIGLDVILDLPRGEQEDARLEKAIADSGSVIIVSEDGFSNQVPSEPLPRFENASLHVAYADLFMEEDDSIRKMFLAPSRKRFPFPVALATYFSEKHLHKDQGGKYYFGEFWIPLASSDPPMAWIDFHPSAPAKVISAQAVIRQQVDSSIFRNKIVLIGQSSEKGRDLVPNPVTRAGVRIGNRSQLSGTEIIAAATDTLLKGDTLETMARYPRWALGLLLGFLVAACAYRHRWFVSIGACVILIPAILGLSFYLFDHRHIWMPFVSIELCLVLALPAGLGYRSVEERRLKHMMEAERRQLMGLFERYVSPDVAAEIWNRREEIVLAGEQRVTTILFSDIRSFTAMTAGVASHEVLVWLNRYLTAMAKVVKDNRGFLNKFIGDGIMVVFGAPLSEGEKEDACRAVRCAMEMLNSMDEWNAHLAPGEKPLAIGIGIHTGVVTVGNVGSPDRLEYSVIGETVNLASRLESLTKDFHVPIVISPATWDLVSPEFPTMHLGESRVRGFDKPISLYSVESKSMSEVSS